MSINKLPIEASLKEVMDKFEEISLQDFSNIDIVVKTELPSVVKNNQIVIIDDIEVNKIILDTKTFKEVSIDENDIYIQLTNHSNPVAVSNNIISSKHEFFYYIDLIYKKVNSEMVLCENVYKGIDNEWVKVSDKKLNIFNDGAFKNDSLKLELGYTSYGIGNVSVLDNSGVVPNSLHLYFNTTNRNCNVSFNSVSPINITKYNKLIFVLEKQSFNSGSYDPYICLGVNSVSGRNTNTMEAKYTRRAFISMTDQVLCEVDVSQLTGEYYLQLGMCGDGYSTTGIDLYFSSIYFTV